MKKITQLVFFVALFCATTIMAQSTIKGVVIDAEFNSVLPGANVVEKGTTNGVSTDFDGKFTLKTQKASGEVIISYVGYGSVTLPFNGDTNLGEITISTDNSLQEVVINASGNIDLVVDRKTPIAVSTVTAKEIALKAGNMEFPEIMNKTPSVYATKQGGGYGDSRITLRGFDQRNTSYLINGQPVNDMENGWVFWSNWQGLTDVASGIQIQRGLGASKLAVPSVGGTVSIVTKNAAKQRGGSLSTMIGNDNYVKSTAIYNTGVNEKGWSSSYLIGKWSGDGYVYNTRGEGYNYFFAVGYQPVGSNHKFNLSFLGAGQWHHQRDVDVSIRDYENFGEDGIDPRWNSNGGILNGKEYNLRRNFYNKPLATLNWDWDITEDLQLATTVYASWGRGGGTGPRGNNFRDGVADVLPFRKDLTEHYLENERGSRLSNGFINFDAIVANNRATTQGYSGDIASDHYAGRLIGSNGFREDGVNRAVLIRRASMNSHDWYGAIANLKYTKNKFTYSLGVDLRDYTGYHYRVVNDLLGLDGYFSTGNENSAGQIINTTIAAKPFRDTGLNGPKINFYNIGNVGWAGINGLIEYDDDEIFAAVLQGGYSNQSFQRDDYFAQPHNPISDTKNIGGGYVKGGVNFNIDDQHNVFGNAGYISRQPNFDAVFPGFANDINPDLQNEEIISFELGYGLKLDNLNVKLNLYNTNWGNRFLTQSADVLLIDNTGAPILDDDGNQATVQGTAQFKDIDVVHRGIELEATYKPINKLRITGMLSIGDWRYTKDFTAGIFDDNNQPLGEELTLFLEDVKVGDAAQFTAFGEVDYKILDNLSVDLGCRYADNLYADYGIEDDAFFSDDNKGALKLPSFTLFDAGATYSFNVLKKRASIRINVNNVFDTLYIAESETNIHAEEGAETWNGIDKTNLVWFGFGRTWNASFKFNF